MKGKPNMLDEPPVAVLQYEKWGGHPHYRGASFHLGDDEFGTWRGLSSRLAPPTMLP